MQLQEYYVVLMYNLRQVIKRSFGSSFALDNLYYRIPKIRNTKQFQTLTTCINDYLFYNLVELARPIAIN